jgi:hypothetical protein
MVDGMELRGPYRYRVAVRCGGYDVTNEIGGATFLAPVTQPGPKLYTFSVDGRLIYIGQTTQDMATRMRLGFRAEGAHGYYGYGWRRALAKADLHVWCLDQIAEQKECPSLECIEAEVVLLCRNVYGQWPSYQTEIHFHESTQEHRDLARRVFALFAPPQKNKATLGIRCDDNA